MTSSGEFKFQGHTVHYWFAGEGQPMIFLHNAGLSHVIWDEQLRHFSKFRKCIAMDLPGYGRSQFSSEIYHTLEFYTDFMKAFVNSLNLSNVILVGNCLGSAIALSFALQCRSEVSKLILFHPLTAPGVRNGILGPAFSLAESSRGLESILKRLALTLRWSRTLAKGVLWIQLGGWDSVTDGLRDRLLEELRSKSAADALSDILLDVRSYEVSDSMQVSKDFPETLIIWGTSNRILKLEAGRKFWQMVPGSQMIEIQGGGHIVMCEFPDECNKMIENFLNNLGEIQ